MTVGILALTVTDLRLTPSEEPRVNDLALAKSLGFEDPHKVRPLIERHLAALRRLGEISATVAEKTGKRGRPGKAFWLTKKQALYICTKSETPRATEVTIELVEVFDAISSGKDLNAPVQTSGNVVSLHPITPADRVKAFVALLVPTMVPELVPAISQAVTRPVIGGVANYVKRSVVPQIASVRGAVTSLNDEMNKRVTGLARYLKNEFAENRERSDAQDKKLDGIETKVDQVVRYITRKGGAQASPPPEFSTIAEAQDQLGVAEDDRSPQLSGALSRSARAWYGRNERLTDKHDGRWFFDRAALVDWWTADGATVYACFVGKA